MDVARWNGSKIFSVIAGIDARAAVDDLEVRRVAPRDRG